MATTCILDYGSGNVRSVYNLFASVSDSVSVSNDPASIEAATHIVLPGVGAFGAAMRRIGETLPMDVVRKAVFDDKKPFLGICVGMQVLADRGLEFGDFAGLGWIGGTVDALQTGDLPVPHIGWNGIQIERPSRLLEGLGADTDFYFLHSFVMRPSNPDVTTVSAEYGERFTCAVERDNIFGVQFHPEKSQKAGRRLVENFLALR
jgi:glutamine amidotransferase